MDAFRTRLRESAPVILDGGIGSELQLRGMPDGERPELFVLARPDILKQMHIDYLKAGADVIMTSTFGGTSYKLAPEIVNGIGVRVYNREMARIAWAAISETGYRAFLAGDIGPSGHFVKPLGDAEPEEISAAYREQALGLLDGGVDLFAVETQFDLAEARLIVAAIREVTDLPIICSMTFDGERCLTGSTPEIFAATMRNMGVDAVGVNCGAGPAQMAGVIDRFLNCAGIPVMAEPNAGLPELEDGRTVYRLNPDDFALYAANFAAKGVKLIGGCCGTGPAHIAAVRKAVERITEYGTPKSVHGVVLTSRSSLVCIGADEPLVFIGERINPTGKKDLQAELQAGSLVRVLELAAEQIAAGAPVLDVNVGAPMADETFLLPTLTKELVGRTATPLSLDSSNPEAIAAALPWYPGSALVNSVSGDAGRMDILGPLCRKWGAPFILLPLEGRTLPVIAKDRIAIIEKMLAQAERLHIPRHLMIVDALALAAASKPEAAAEALKTIRWCTEAGLPTVIGLSNISFGLPARELVNSVFLAMAQGAGLSACIVNPLSVRMNETRAAGDVLMNKDIGAARFTTGYAEWTAGAANGGIGSKAAVFARPKNVYDAIIAGDRDVIEELIRAELNRGRDPFELVNKVMIAAITEVGDKYGKKEIFLPQLLRSAETMQAGFAVVKPHLNAENGADEHPVVVLATVEGDIHDIGKNIVSLMLGNHGFTVIDIGKDVKAADIVEAAKKYNASVIGLSALMTTTMVRMEDTVRLVREQALDMHIVIGGAVVTDSFADSIGAVYAADAVDAVKVIQNLLKIG